MKNRKSIFIMLAAIMILLFTGRSVYAASVTQTKLTQDSATISWKDPSAGYSSFETTGYEIRIKPYSSQEKIDSLSPVAKLNAGATSYTFSKLSEGTRYQVRVSYTYRSTSTGKSFSSYLSSSDICTKPGKLAGLKQQKWWHYINSVDVTWTPQDACCVEWIAYNNSNKKVASGTTTSTYTNRFSFKTKNTIVYHAKARAVLKLNGKVYKGAWSGYTYLFDQPMITKGSVANNKLTVKWDKVKGCTSYVVYASTKEKTGYKKIKTVSSGINSCTIAKIGSTKIKSGKTYYVYIVGVKKVSGHTYTSGRHYSARIKGSSATTLWTFDK